MNNTSARIKFTINSILNYSPIGYLYLINQICIIMIENFNHYIKWIKKKKYNKIKAHNKYLIFLLKIEKFVV